MLVPGLMPATMLIQSLYVQSVKGERNTKEERPSGGTYVFRKRLGQDDTDGGENDGSQAGDDELVGTRSGAGSGGGTIERNGQRVSDTI